MLHSLESKYNVWQPWLRLSIHVGRGFFDLLLIGGQAGRSGRRTAKAADADAISIIVVGKIGQYMCRSAGPTIKGLYV